MTGFGGFEPQVGQIRALRTFRIGPGGWLYPLFSNRRWTDGVNTAGCLRAPSTAGPVPGTTAGTTAAPMAAGAADGGGHTAPEPDCSCGFYAYGSAEAAGEYPYARHVQAVVSCWGRVIAGTRGLRAQHCRIEGLWLSAAVPEDLAAEVAARYPTASVHQSPQQLLGAHPLTELDCYTPPSRGRRGLSARWLAVATAVATVCGLLPVGWLGGASTAALVWGAGVAVFVCLGVGLLARRGADTGVRRQGLLCLAAACWLWAPLAGFPGPWLIRLPLLEFVGLALVRRVAMLRAASRFPADIG